MRAALILLLALLTACGGGDPEPEDGRAFVGPPDCRAQPELCR